MTNIKLIVCAVALAAISAFGLWVNHLVKTVDEQKVTIIQKNETIALRDSSIKIRDERIAKTDKQVNDTAEYLRQQKVRDDENKKFRDCVAAGRCGVRFTKASCPARLPEAGPDISGSSATDIRFDAGVEQLILGFREKIMHNQGVCDARIKQLQEDRK